MRQRARGDLARDGLGGGLKFLLPELAVVRVARQVARSDHAAVRHGPCTAPDLDPVDCAGLGRGWRSAELNLVVPNDPSLAGQKVSNQVFMADSGAADGVSHTGGLELTLGH
jgi:hypothetical protein